MSARPHVTAMRTRLGRVRGLGSARDGVGHWWAQRLTALALVPLLLWLVASIVALAGAPYAAVRAWLESPVTAVLLSLLLAIGFHHLQLGLQVVIEDYVHTEWVRMTLILGAKALSLVAAAFAIFFVLRVAFGA